MSNLEDLWTIITNTTLSRKSSEVSATLAKNQSALISGLTSYTRLSKRNATSLTTDDVVRALSRQQLEPTDLQDRARILTQIVHTLYLDVKSASSLLEKSAEASGKSVSTLTRLSTTSATEIVLKFYFQQRRLILAVHGYLHRNLRTISHEKPHPFHQAFVKFVEDDKYADFYQGLLEEFGFAINLLKDYVDNPSFDLQRIWLTLQLQELRDTLFLLFDISHRLPKTKSSVESVVRSVFSSGHCLQKFPVSPDKIIGSVQLELVQQVSHALSAFLFSFFSSGVPLFLRDDSVTEYLNNVLPGGSSLLVAAPATIMWLVSQLEGSQQWGMENLETIFSQVNPFAVLVSVLESDTLVDSRKEVLAGSISNFGEQFLRIFGVDGLGQLSSSLYRLAGLVFRHPKEAVRFWHRWTEGAGTDVSFGWGVLFSTAKDSLPLGFDDFLRFATSLFIGLPVGSSTVSQLDRMLWNLDTFTEVDSVHTFKHITLIEAQTEGVSAVRTELRRLPYGSDAVIIPPGTYGYMINRGPNEVQFKWILHDPNRFSIWTISALRLSQLLSNWKELMGEAVQTVAAISGFYCAAMKSSPTTHDDLQDVLQLLCRALGCLFHAYLNSVDQFDGRLHSVVEMIFDVCGTEVTFLGPQFLHDFDLLAPVFPKTTRESVSDSDWIRNGDLAWFSALWQKLCQKSNQTAFMKVLTKLADVQLASLRTPAGKQSGLPLSQQSNIFILNIGLQFLAQLDDPSEGIRILKYTLAVLGISQSATELSLTTVATDCLLEGPAGQALVELLNFSNRTLSLFVRNANQASVEDYSTGHQVNFVQLVLETIYRLLEMLPVRPPTIVTSFERALLTAEKTRLMESISVNTREVHNRHPVLQLIRLISQAKDAKIVQLATQILSRLIVLQQPSLMTIAKDDAEDFLKSVFWLLQEASEDVSVELWRFLTLCDSRQPRLLDLFINLVYRPENKKFAIDIDTLPSLLDILVDTLSGTSSKKTLSAALCFCLEIFSSKNDYLEYLSLSECFWRAIFDTLQDIPQVSIGWENKLNTAYALDILALSTIPAIKTILFSAELVESQWTNYVAILLPKIFLHLNKDVPKLLHALDESSEAIRNLTRFFTSWSSMHLMAFNLDSLDSLITQETRLNTIRTLFIVLNRSLLSSSSSMFVISVASFLSQFLQAWRDDLSVIFFASIFHIIEEFTVLVCGHLERDNWTDSARHSILSVTLLALDLISQVPAGSDKSSGKLPLERVHSVMIAAVDVVGYTALKWDPMDGSQDQKGVMLSYAVGVIKNCVRLTTRPGSDGSRAMGQIRDLFFTSSLYELLLTKIIQLLTGRLPQIAQSFVGLFLLMSQDDESATRLNAAGLATCLGLPLAGSVARFKELLTERDVQTATIDDVVASKERSMEAQDIFEVYLTSLAVEFNIMRADRFRFEDAQKFIGTQLSCIPDVLEALRGTPTMFTFRLVEILTRLKAEASRHPMPLSGRQNCFADVPAIFHAMCGQIMRRSGKLTEDQTYLSTPTMELVFATAINCLQVLNSVNPGFAALLTEDEFVAESSLLKVIVEYSFANPASSSLSPNLSFGTFVHVIKTGLEVLSKENLSTLEPVIFSTAPRKSGTTLTKLVDFVERSTHFFMFQAAAFAIGLTELTGERWQETLRELTNEIMDLRHVMHNFLTAVEDAVEPNSPIESPVQRTCLLGLLSENMLTFRNFYDDAKDQLGGNSKSYQSMSLLATPKTDRKRVTFML